MDINGYIKMNTKRKMWLQENPNIQRPISKSSVSRSGNKKIKASGSARIKCPNCP